MTVSELYEYTKSKGDKYLNYPIILKLPYNTELDVNIDYEIGSAKVSTDKELGDGYIFIMPDLD